MDVAQRMKRNASLAITSLYCLSTEFLHFLRGFAPGFVNYQKGCTRLAATCDKVYQLLAHGRWFSPGTPASSTTKTVRYDIAEILLKVALNTINQSINQSFSSLFIHDQNIFIFLHYSSIRGVRVRNIVLNATFNNISVISWRSVLLVEETKVLGKNHQPSASHTDKLYHISCIEYPSQYAVFELTTLVVIDTDCTGSCKFNNHTITTATAPSSIIIFSCCQISIINMSIYCSCHIAAI